MGCAFSSTQIFLVDSKQTKKGINNSSVNNNFARTIIQHAKQGFNRSYIHGTTIIGSGGALLLATKFGKDVILVGQLKSNGTYSRRRPSSEAKFIEQRRKLSGALTQKKISKEENQSNLLLNKRSNRLIDQNAINSEAPISGPIDFQKRLENLKIKRNEENEDEIMNKINEYEEDDELCTKLKNKISPKEQKKKQLTEEKEVIMHRTEQESTITDGALDQWDSLSNTTLSGGADCCSQIGGRIGLQKQLHDGDVSEASFVFVKRKLKVAWEHHQILQIRKQSFIKREGCDNQQQLSNNWIPEITTLIDENE